MCNVLHSLAITMINRLIGHSEALIMKQDDKELLESCQRAVGALRST